MKQNIMVALKGMLVGGTMLVPGVSGGSMAMILGIYHKLVVAISSFTKDKKRNLCFLLLFCIGAVTGMVLFANPLLTLLETYPMPMSYFFMGAVAGGIPLILEQADIKKWSGSVFFWLMFGIVIVVLLARISAGIFEPGQERGIGSLLLLFLAGIIVAIALILPGISVSYMLLLLGLYDTTVEAVGRLDILFLLPLGIGVVAGILLTTRMLERAMERYTEQTYLIILGFVLASVAELFPGIPSMRELIVCVAAMILGYIALRSLSAYKGEEG